MAENENIPGVSRFVKRWKGKEFPYWQSKTKDENGRWKSHQFFIKKRGEDEARRLAVESRMEWEKEARKK